MVNGRCSESCIDYEADRSCIGLPVDPATLPSCLVRFRGMANQNELNWHFNHFDDFATNVEMFQIGSALVTKVVVTSFLSTHEHVRLLKPLELR